MQLNYNERSWAIDVIVEINRLCSLTRRPIRKAGGEKTLHTEEKERLFPDVLLFGDESQSFTLQGWELKMPDTPITDQEFIVNAKKKAKALGLNSFLLWNVTTAVLYVSRGGSDFAPEHNWNNLTDISRREEVERNRTKWVTGLGTILNDLNDFFERGTLIGKTIAESFSQSAIVDIVLESSSEVASMLREAVRRDVALDTQINVWWSTTKREHPDQSEPWEILAKTNLMNWMNKIIFAHVLKAFFSEASNIEKINVRTPPLEALNILAEISKTCNFWNVFQRGMGEEVLSVRAWREINQINLFLSEVKFKEIDQELLHALLQQTVFLSKRKVAGQYVTPQPLADLLCRLVVLNKEKRVYDPFCGSGTIARASYELKLEYGIDSTTALSNVWASDKFSFPLQISTIALVDPKNIGCLLRVFKSDVVDLVKGMEVNFIDPNNGSNVKENLPEFDYIISNLPFVQQEDLDNVNPKVKEINRRIREMLGRPLELDARSDLFAYLPFYLWDILSEEGRLGIITSNSWLATTWGNRFRELLQNFFQIEKIIISGKGRWFQNADVVTTLVILKKRAKIGLPEDSEPTSFFVLLQSLAEWGQDDTSRRELASFMLREQPRPDRFLVKRYSYLDIQRLESLGLQWSSMFADLEFVTKISDKLIPVEELFDVNRGERRGWDDLFYPEEGAHNIERSYLRPVLKSPKEIEGLIAEPRSQAFCCSLSLEELRRLNHRGALEWIGRFEHAVNKRGRPLPQVLVRGGMHWYEMNDSTMADLVTFINPDERLFLAKMKEPAFVNQRLIRFTRKSESLDVNICHALLNSVLGIFYLQALGFGRGLGVLDLSTTRIRDFMQMLNPHLLQEPQRREIITRFSSLLNRPALPLEEELGSSNRQDFDKVVLESYGIGDCHAAITNALLILYKIRSAVKTREN